MGATRSAIISFFSQAIADRLRESKTDTASRRSLDKSATIASVFQKKSPRDSVLIEMSDLSITRRPVNRYRFPVLQRFRIAGWRLLNELVDRIRASVWRPSNVLLVTGNAPEAKVAEVQARLEFLFSHLRRNTGFRRARSAPISAYFRNTGVVAVDTTAVPAIACRRVGWVADLDYEANPYDGWALLDFGAAVASDALEKSVAAGREVFFSRVREITANGLRPAYLFGTGPSLGLAGARSFRDGTTVVCNTIVRDAALWHQLKPAFFTAGDAIYHFGHTDHARAFRLDALRRLEESEGRTLFVYPAPFDVIVRSEFQDVEEVLVPIPWGEHTDITVDLLREYALPQVGNVLNALLLPLGCTLSNDIRLWGFDGRAPTDSGFWSNSSRHAYPELMQSLRDSHPAFFAELVPRGNESRYVNQVHGDLLDERLSEAEDRGFRFELLHPSWTPTLQKRYYGSDDVTGMTDSATV
ncbi:MAG: hypothetical protein KIH64_015460 [Mycobacterium sp.]|nr:hypothetical protein [Mycobacterium sp.]